MNTHTVTLTKQPADGSDTTTWNVLVDGQVVGYVARSRETSTVLYAGAGYGRPVTRTEWWANGQVPANTPKGFRYYSSGYGRTTRKDALTDFLAALLQQPRNAVADLVPAR